MIALFVCYLLSLTT